MAEFYYEECGKDGDIVRVVLSGKLDAFLCDYLFDCIQHQIEEGCRKLILDCNDLEFISSVGMGMLMRVHSRMKKHGGDVKLARLHGLAASAVSLVRLDKILQMFPTVEEAVAAHGG